MGDKKSAIIYNSAKNYYSLIIKNHLVKEFRGTNCSVRKITFLSNNFEEIIIKTEKEFNS